MKKAILFVLVWAISSVGFSQPIKHLGNLKSSKNLKLNNVQLNYNQRGIGFNTPYLDSLVYIDEDDGDIFGVSFRVDTFGRLKTVFLDNLNEKDVFHYDAAGNISLVETFERDTTIDPFIQTTKTIFEYNANNDIILYDNQEFNVDSNKFITETKEVFHYSGTQLDSITFYTFQQNSLLQWVVNPFEKQIFAWGSNNLDSIEVFNYSSFFDSLGNLFNYWEKYEAELFKYDNNGNLIEETIYDAGWQFSYRVEKEKSKYAYNADNQCISDSIYDYAPGIGMFQLTGTTTCTYEDLNPALYTEAEDYGGVLLDDFKQSFQYDRSIAASDVIYEYIFLYLESDAYDDIADHSRLTHPPVSVNTDELDNATSWVDYYTINFYYSDKTVSINEKNKEGITLYPNPSDGMIFLSSPSKNLGYTVYSLNGSVELRGRLTSQTINLSILSNGIYFIKFANEEIKKIVIRK